MQSRYQKSYRSDKARAARTLAVLIGGGLTVAATAHYTTAQEATLPTPLTPVLADAFAPTTAPTRAGSGAGDTVVTDGVGADGRLKLTVNKTAVIGTRGAYKRVSVGSPDIADVNPIGPGNILVTAKKVGSTQIIVWDENDRSQVIDVTVEFDMQAMQDQLKEMFPDSKITVSSLNGAVALRGHVPNLQTAEQAVAMASPYSAKVLNFLEISGGQQVMLQVRIAEMSRRAVTNLGVNTYLTDGKAQLGFINGPGGSPIGAVANHGAAAIDGSVSVFSGGAIGKVAFENFLSAMISNNLARVLAEPTLTAMSGQEANFLAGGEIPVPVPQSSNGGGTTITIEYKKFGVQLRFVPVVLGDGRIRLKVNPEVSELDYSNAVTLSGTQIPAFNERNLETTVELNQEQTLAIGGLLNHRVAANSAETPVLGQVPILGALFRSVRYERQETELMVLVTPHIVSAMSPDEVPALPGENWQHPSEADLLLNANLGSEVMSAKGAGGSGCTTQPALVADRTPARFRGQFGFAPATQPVASAQ